MKEVVEVKVGGDDLISIVEDGEVTGYRPVNITHLNKDIAGCIVYYFRLRDALRRTRVSSGEVGSLEGKHLT